MSGVSVLDSELLDAAGQPTTLRRHLHEAALVVVLLRHFG